MRPAFRHVFLAGLFLAGLTAPSSAQTVRLAWDPSPDVVAAYVVQYGTAPGTYTKEAFVAGTATVADIGSLTAGKRHYFVVRAVNAAGLRSVPTNEVNLLVSAGGTSTPPPDQAETPPPPPEPQVGFPAGSALRAVPALAAPRGTKVKVSSVTQLVAAVKAIKSDTTIELAAGTYKLPSTLAIAGAFRNIGLRGATTNAGNVVIVGPGLTATKGALDGIRTSGGVTGITVANLTLKSFPGTPVVLQDTHQAVLHNVRVHGDGRFVRGLSTISGKPALAGTIQYSRFYYEGARTDYRSGIDLERAASWRIRYNVFSNATPTSKQRLGATIVAWRESSHTIVEGNTFVNCAREIVLGMAKTSPNPHSGGFVRNNMIVRTTAVKGASAGISVLDSPGTTVVYNTLLLRGTGPRAIEYRYPDTTKTIVANNLSDGPVQALDGATGVEDTNVTTATASWFASPATGDLRLLSTATVPMDSAAAVGRVADDHGGQARPYGAGPDVGADEARTFEYK